MTAKTSRAPVRSAAGERPAKLAATRAARKPAAANKSATGKAAARSAASKKTATQKAATGKGPSEEGRSRKAATKKAATRPPATGSKPARAAAKTAAKPARAGSGAGKAPALLSGGNPQIAKGEGDAPVQAYIAAMPGWKRAVGQRLDALILEAVPNAHKAVKWNSPFYGIRGQGWFLSFHCFERYIKLAFFRGTSLRPMPPEPSKTAHTRYLHVYQNQPFDEAQFLAWAEQASRLPGERM